MKTSYLCAVALPLLAGCSYEAAQEPAAQNGQHILQYRGGGDSPENDDNPYDYVGQVFHEMAYSCHQDTISPTTISGIITQVETIGNSNSRFELMKDLTYAAPSSSAVSNLQSYGTDLLPGILDSSGMSTTGRSSMLLLVELIINQSENADPFEDNYETIADFEDAVLIHSSLTTYDKKVLLIVSSVGRHSVSLVKKKPKKNKDPDWNVLIINITAAVDGALRSEAEAISMGLVSGVLENL